MMSVRYISATDGERLRYLPLDSTDDKCMGGEQSSYKKHSIPHDTQMGMRLHRRGGTRCVQQASTSRAFSRLGNIGIRLEVTPAPKYKDLYVDDFMIIGFLFAIVLFSFARLHSCRKKLYFLCLLKSCSGFVLYSANVAYIVHFQNFLLYAIVCLGKKCLF